MRTLGTIFLLFLGSTAAGCMSAAVHPQVYFDGSWAEDPAKDREVRAQLDEKEASLLQPRPENEAVEVFVGKLPSGIKLESGVLSTEKDAPYEILGKAVITVGEGTQFGFPDYEDGWRKGLCYWQAPLTWATLMIWAIVPVNYPCGVDAARPKEEVLTATKNLVRELGGHLFVGEYIIPSQDEAWGMTGFVIRKIEQAAPEPAPANGPTGI